MKLARPRTIVVAALVVLVLVLLRHGKLPMSSPPDLRRLTFPSEGLAVTEHGPGRLEVFAKGWWINLEAVDSGMADQYMKIERQIIASNPNSRADVIKVPGGPTIHRFLRGTEGEQRAVQSAYVVSFPEGWLWVIAASRTADVFDVTPIDNFLGAMRFADAARPGSEVLPAWQAYQRDRRPGMPVAKYEITMDPAPVWLGSRRSKDRDFAMFTKAEFASGGRQAAADLIEFYVKDDPLNIRLDVWLNARPDMANCQRVFEGTLQIEEDSLHVWSMGEPYFSTIPSGDYDVIITLLNRGAYPEKMLSHQERFDREELERYEVWLNRRPGG